MTARRGWWRTIPPELGVPLALCGAVQAFMYALDLAGDVGVVGMASVAQRWMMLFGLLELRRRALHGRAALAVAVGAQTLSVIAWSATYLFGGIPGEGGVVRMVEYWTELAAMIAVAALIAGTARRSRLALGVVGGVAAALTRPGVVLAFVEDFAVVSRVVAVAWIVYSVGMLLALAGRAGTREPDLARAARAAGRAAWAWRIRAVMYTALVLALVVRGSEGLLPLGFVLALVVTLVHAAFATSAMLGLARAGLPAPALCVAAFGALCLARPSLSILAIVAPAYQPRYAVGEVLAIALPLAGVLGAAWVARREVARTSDRARDRRVTALFAVAVASQLAVPVILALRGDRADRVLLGLLAVLAEIVGAQALVWLYGKLRERLALAAQTEVF